MFKKKCKKCGTEIKGKYNYCPSCGAPLKNEKDYGLLGKEDSNDSFNNFFNEINLPKGFNMIFNQLMKNFDKQFQDFDKQIKESGSKKPKIKKSGISIKISSLPGKPPEINIKPFDGKLKKQNIGKFKKKDMEKTQTNYPSSKKLPKKTLKKISKMPKQEPETSIRRFSDKIVYEIKMPDVKSIKDVSIIRLENSMEIKALAKDKAYVKLIPISMPIKNYKLSKGKLILELEAQG